MRKCTSCRVEKPLFDFHKGEWKCKACKNESSKKWQSENIEKVRRNRRSYHLRSTYGITEEEYNEKFQEQFGACAICGTHQSDLSKTLGQDHDHESQNNRGLLCDSCNRGISNFKDSIVMLKAAIAYLEKWGYE